MGNMGISSRCTFLQLIILIFETVLVIFGRVHMILYVYSMIGFRGNFQRSGNRNRWNHDLVVPRQAGKLGNTNHNS